MANTNELAIIASAMWIVWIRMWSLVECKFRVKGETPHVLDTTNDIQLADVRICLFAMIGIGNFVRIPHSPGPAPPAHEKSDNLFAHTYLFCVKIRLRGTTHGARGAHTCVCVYVCYVSATGTPPNNSGN